VPGFSEAGTLILSDPFGAGDAILITGSDNRSPLVLSTSTTVAPIMRLRYFAEICWFSNSTNVMTEFMRALVGRAQNGVN
jgi:hypothetical protein